jgi:uncharacterized protein
MYNLADTRWREQPGFMTERVARQTAFRIREHCKIHGLKRIYIDFHGGEPLLGGASHIHMLTSVIEETIGDSDIDFTLTMQSNGLLFTPEIGDLMLDKKISLGISLDGPPEINDIYRVDHQDRPSSSRLEKKLALLTAPPYRKIFGSFLSVINIRADPLVVIKYLLSYNPPTLDFLLPDYNYDRRPPGKENDIDATLYGDWLIKAFDYWFYLKKTNTEIRTFNSIIRQIFGGRSLVESLGLDPVNLIVVETNGDIEAVDSLKSTYNGATWLGYNVFQNDFDTVAADIAIKNRQKGDAVLCHKCKECPVVNICGGGYLPHRYSKEKGFDNPSIYSADLEKLISHIYNVLLHEVPRTTRKPIDE